MNIVATERMKLYKIQESENKKNCINALGSTYEGRDQDNK